MTTMADAVCEYLAAEQAFEDAQSAPSPDAREWQIAWQTARDRLRYARLVLADAARSVAPPTRGAQ